MLSVQLRRNNTITIPSVSFSISLSLVLALSFFIGSRLPRNAFVVRVASGHAVYAINIPGTIFL